MAWLYSAACHAASWARRGPEQSQNRHGRFDWSQQKLSISFPSHAPFEKSLSSRRICARRRESLRAIARAFSIQLKLKRYDFVYHSYSLILKAGALFSRSVMESGVVIKMAEDRKGR